MLPLKCIQLHSVQRLPHSDHCFAGLLGFCVAQACFVESEGNLHFRFLSQGLSATAQSRGLQAQFPASKAAMAGRAKREHRVKVGK